MISICLIYTTWIACTDRINQQAGGWEGNFETYLETVHDWESTGGSIMKTYYYGNIFVTYYARNASMFSFYSKLYNFTKGVWP